MAVGDGFGLGVVLETKELFAGGFQRFGQAVKDVEGITSASGQKITDNLKVLGTGLAIFGAGIGGLAMLAAPTKAFGEFAAGIAEITTLSDEASLSTLNLGEMVMKMNAAYGGSAAKQTKALYDGISAGASNASEAMALLDASNKLGVAGRAEVGVALDGLTSAANAYGDSFANAATYSDALFVAVQKGKTTIPELAGVIGRVAPTASAMGVSFDEVSASLAAVTLKGLKTEEAATGLKAAMTNIIQPTSSATAEAAKLGIKFDQTALKSKGLKGFLDSITGSSNFSATSLSQLFTSTEALNTVLALTADGSSKFNDALAAMGNKTGATDKAFEKMSATTEFQGKRFAGLAENAMILIGSVLDPMKARVMALGNAFLEAFNTLPDGVREWLVKGFALASTLLVIVGGAIALKGAIGVLAAGFSAAGVTAASFGAMLAPIVLGLAGIALAVYAFRIAWDRNLGGIATTIRQGVDDVKLVFGAFAQLLEDGGISGAIREDLNKAENGGLKNFVKTVFLFGSRIVELFKSIGGGFSDAFADAGPVFDALSASVSRVIQVFGGLSKAIDPGAAKAQFDGFSSAGRTIGSVLGAVAKAVVTIFTVAMDIVGGFVSKLAPVGDLIGTTFSVLGDVFTEVGDIASELGLLGTAVDGSASGWVAFGETLGNVVSVAASLVKSLVMTIGSALKSALNIIGGVLDLFTGNFERGIERILYGIVSLISGVILGAIELVATASDALLGTDFAKSVTSWRKGLDDTLKSGFNLAAPAAAENEAAGATPGSGMVVPPAASFAPSAESGFRTAGDAASMYSPEALASAIATGVSKTPAPKAGPTYVNVKLDSRDIRASIEAGERSDGDANGAPGMSVMD
jgi:TP901 family phage tail tape measure protein